MARKNREKTTLITRFSALGDIAMSLGAIYDTARQYPERKFVLLTRPRAAEMFLNPPSNLKVVGVDLAKEGSIGDIVKMTGRLDAEHRFDTYADLHDVLRTKLMRILLRLRGVKVRKVEKSRKRRKRLTRKRNKDLRPLTPMQLRYRQVFSELGMPAPERFKGVFSGAVVLSAEAMKIMGRAGAADIRLIGIAPFARHEGKIYPAYHMAQVIRELSRLQKVKLFVFGAGERERAEIDKMIPPDAGNVVNMAAVGASMRAELEIMSRCKVMVSMDSANMHLASLAGCRVLSVWGATHPFTGFYNELQNPKDAIQLPLPCRPCSIFGNTPCRRGDYACLTLISPSMITQKIRDLL